MSHRFTDEEKRELDFYRQSVTDKKALRRLEALELRAKGMRNREISALTGFHPQYITVLVSQYKRGGIGSILAKRDTSDR